MSERIRHQRGVPCSPDDRANHRVQLLVQRCSSRAAVAFRRAGGMTGGNFLSIQWSRDGRYRGRRVGWPPTELFRVPGLQGVERERRRPSFLVAAPVRQSAPDIHRRRQLAVSSQALTVLQPSFRVSKTHASHGDHVSMESSLHLLKAPPCVLETDRRRRLDGQLKHRLTCRLRKRCRARLGRRV